MEFITARANALDCAEISLTVHKSNDRSIKAYEGMGFRTTEEAVVDIGGGYVMDDYRMAKPLRSN